MTITEQLISVAEARAIESGLGARRGLASTSRSFAVADVTVRAADNASSPMVDFSGHASTWEPYEMYGGPDKGGWVEHVDRGAFKATLGRKPEVPLLVGHMGDPLAATWNDTVQLAEDDTGLFVRAQLDTNIADIKSTVQRLQSGLLREMSFAFRVRAQTWLTADGEEVPWWDPAGIERHLTELDIHKGDVSIVTFGANPTTDAALRKLIGNMDPEEATALRGMVALGALAEKRAGTMLSPAAIAVCQSVLDLVAGADDNLDDALEQLSALMGVPNPDEPEGADEPAEDEPSMIGQSAFVHPDLVAAQHRAYRRSVAIS